MLLSCSRKAAPALFLLAVTLLGQSTPSPSALQSKPPIAVLQSAPTVIERVRPTQGMPPCAPFAIVVEGRNLPFNGTVVLAGVPLATTPGNGAQLIATVTSAALATPGSVPLVVRTSNQTESAPFLFLVNPTPIQAIQPTSAPIGSPDLALEVRGDCFEAGATVLWNGTPLSTTFVGANTLDAVVPAGNLAAAGVARVSVRNANGNTSVSFPFRIGPPPGAGPAPVITSLAPPEAIAGAASSTVSVNGSNFDSQATVLLDGVPAPKANVLWRSAGRLTLTLTAVDLATGRSITVEVRNPDGVLSNPAKFLVRPVITGVTPPTWTVGQPCDLFIAGRGFAPNSEALIDGPAGMQRVTPTAAPTPTQMNVCMPTPQVSAPGRIQVSVCTPGAAGEVCSDPFTMDVASGLTITRLRPMSAPAGSASLCLAVDVTAPGGDPGALIARWDGADLPPGAAQCPGAAGLQPAVTQVAQGVFATTVLAQVDAALLARPRPRDPTVPCSADPIAPKITAFSAGLQAESAPVCFDITPLRPTLQPPTFGPAPNGCVSVSFLGQLIHRSAEVIVDGLQGGFCQGGEPMISGCGLNGDSSICNQVTLIVPSGTGVINVRIRNPDEVCPDCPPETFTVDIQQAFEELPPDALSLQCGQGATSLPRTPVGSQSRLSCQVGNASDAAGSVGELTIAEPFSIAASDCAEAVIEPGGSCAVDLLFAPVRAGLFTSELTLVRPNSSAALGRYLGVGILRSATLSVLGDALTPAGQSAVRIETDGAEGSDVLVLLRQSLRLNSSVPVFPAGEGAPDVDCGFPAAVAGVEYAQPLVAACDTAGASWEAAPLDAGGSWLEVNGNQLQGTPTETGVFDYEIRLSPAFPNGSAAVTRTCSITVVDTPLANGSASGSAPLTPCTSAQFAMGGARQQVPLVGDGPTDVAFQTGTLTGDLRFIASFEADGVDVSPPPTSSGGASSGVEADASIALQAPVIASAAFSCPTGSQLVVEASGYSSTREIASMRFDFQPAAGATGSLQLGPDAATRPDLVSAFQTRYNSGSGAGELDGGFQMRAIFAINGRTADIGGVTLTLQNSVGGATATATGSCR